MSSARRRRAGGGKEERVDGGALKAPGGCRRRSGPYRCAKTAFGAPRPHSEREYGHQGAADDPREGEGLRSADLPGARAPMYVVIMSMDWPEMPIIDFGSSFDCLLAPYSSMHVSA